MAFVVRRPGGRWEFRESFTTDAGPRARTLASFKSLSPQIVEHAVRRARGPVDREELLRAAKRAGVPIERAPADELAESLLRRLARGERVRRALGRALVEHLEARSALDDSFTEWIGAPIQQRADALIDLLDLGESLPPPARRSLRYPPPPRT